MGVVVALAQLFVVLRRVSSALGNRLELYSRRLALKFCPAGGKNDACMARILHRFLMCGRLDVSTSNSVDRNPPSSNIVHIPGRMDGSPEKYFADSRFAIYTIFGAMLGVLLLKQFVK